LGVVGGGARQPPYAVGDVRARDAVLLVRGQEVAGLTRAANRIVRIRTGGGVGHATRDGSALRTFVGKRLGIIQEPMAGFARCALRVVDGRACDLRGALVDRRAVDADGAAIKRGNEVRAALTLRTGRILRVRAHERRAFLEVSTPLAASVLRAEIARVA